MSESKIGSSRTLASDVNKGTKRNAETSVDALRQETSGENISKQQQYDPYRDDPVNGRTVAMQDLLERQLDSVGSSAARGSDDTSRANNGVGVVAGFDYAGADTEQQIAEVDREKLQNTLDQASEGTLNAFKESAVMQPEVNSPSGTVFGAGKEARDVAAQAQETLDKLVEQSKNEDTSRFWRDAENARRTPDITPDGKGNDQQGGYAR